MEAELSIADLGIANQVEREARDGSGDLEQSTDFYIETIRKYADDLGDEEVRRRLTDTASEVEPYCPLCASRLDRERDNY